LSDWFSKTRDLLLVTKPIPYIRIGRGYVSKANIGIDNALTLTYTSDEGVIESVIKDFPNCDYTRFQQSTRAITREKVFAKWLKEDVENDSEYCKVKRECAIVAGMNIVSLLSPYKNTSPKSLLRLFRPEPFYFAKTTTRSIEIYKVPSKNEFTSPVIIKNIEAKIPQHQLNIHTTLENTQSKKFVEFRSELRYSHGQFNGTPEAKFYIANGDMTAFYDKLYPK